MKKLFSIIILITFLTNVALPASAQEIFLPAPGSMVGISPSYTPIAIKGLKIYPDNPLRFDFILDTGNSKLQGDKLTEESNLQIKYFLAALTVPDDDQWVNLSPYEKDRIIPDAFGITEMGRDLLAQDYLLKQLTASLIYPEHELGKAFWKRVYTKAAEKYGDVNMPVSTFNKVWVMPDHAKVYENGPIAFITESHLKVMLEEDYVAMQQSPSLRGASYGGDEGISKQMASPLAGLPSANQTAGARNDIGSQLIREVVLPEIEKEVNEGRNFTKLRQVYQSMIMAAWFKRKLKDGFLSKVYVGANKVNGIDLEDKNAKQKIYDQYLEAFKKGVYNYIKEEYDQSKQETVPRKYFSGGFAGEAVRRTTNFEQTTLKELNTKVSSSSVGSLITASSALQPTTTASSALVNQTLEIPVFNNAIKYLPYNSSQQYSRQQLLANINAAILPKIVKILDAKNSLSILNKVVLKKSAEHLLENAVNAIIRKLDAIREHNPGDLQMAIAVAKITFSYQEHPEKNEFEIMLADNGDGVADEIYDAWINGRQATTKPNPGDRLSGPTIGGRGLAVLSILYGSTKDNFTVSFESKRAGEVARKFIQTPDEEKSIVHFPAGKGRTEPGTTVTITGPLTKAAEPQTASAAVTADDVLTEKAKPDNLGGIDMNSQALDLETSGEGVDYNSPIDPIQLQNLNIDGFTPVILQIIPTNLPLLLGEKEEETATQLSAR